MFVKTKKIQHKSPDGSVTITYVYKEAETSIPNDAPKLDKGELEVTRYVTDKGIEVTRR